MHKSYFFRDKTNISIYSIAQVFKSQKSFQKIRAHVITNDQYTHHPKMFNFSKWFAFYIKKSQSTGHLHV